MLPDKIPTREDFFSAVKDGNIDMVRQFIANGGDINIVDEGDENKTALHYAVELNNYELLKFLLAQRNITLNPLTCDQDPDIIKFVENQLINDGFEVNTDDFNNALEERKYHLLGQSPMDMAFFVGKPNLNIIFVLVERANDANTDGLDKVNFVDLERTRRGEATGFNGCGKDPRSSPILDFANAFKFGKLDPSVVHQNPDIENQEIHTQKTSIMNLMLQKTKPNDIIGDLKYLYERGSENYLGFLLKVALELPNTFDKDQKAELSIIKELLFQTEEEKSPNSESRSGSFWGRSTPISSTQISKRGIPDLSLDDRNQNRNTRLPSFVAFTANLILPAQSKKSEQADSDNHYSVEDLNSESHRPSSHPIITRHQEKKVATEPSCCTLS